jgi:hypothetical protein
MKNKFTLFAFFSLLFSFHTAWSQTWSVLTSGTSNNILGVSAVNANLVYVSGTTGLVLKTIN